MLSIQGYQQRKKTKNNRTQKLFYYFDKNKAK